ncbi:lipoprotein localization protein LolB [Vibrio sp. V27_P1S3P104]|uniref:lipoprotein insertase outer membrane protein LolB n=1 Tax=unclassified Vibrio TaxID=2614977 RepID=UPI0013731149|nr:MULTISPECIES: lipoprotein insertase outer membrane protein LolB [unclassified Vibrio]NAW68491.1 lipoprotein localization protein LolB [Vibrio sp. V28_P6S34P95]NAX06524.1 lipoprotein localization protein LolB [Vibrio sp. V30_P3S12P165]NAX33632.1 lipoprotein localization protein LolB [Vibrio sp. V29_P1S30P107]NAX38735.1 lipoprotein localization protein LolB [Vibrio sp. V27_P1S3P104]NAX40954.1 lipoprotein localization protein LolB [Vibrio sp. V26_P1S5P106]
MTAKAQIFLLFFFIITFTGCSTISQPISEVQWQTHQDQLKKIKHFQLVGKLGYRSPEQRQSLHFQWQTDSNGTQLRLTTFLGQTILNLSFNEHGAQVLTHDDRLYQATSAQQLVQQLTGLDLPIELLQEWILGLPSQADQFDLNSHNTLAWLDKTIEQQTWRVNYQRYREYPWQQITLPLPEKLTLSQESTSINLVISQWTLTP